MSVIDLAFQANLDALLAHVRGEVVLSEDEVSDLDIVVRTLAGIGTQK